MSELPANFQAEIETLRTGLIPVRRQLRDLRRTMREDVESLGRRLTAVNLAAGPLFAIAFAGIMTWSRKRNRSGRTAE